jgi:hypothetical protein
MCDGAAGEMLHVAEPFLERSLHPTVIIRGYVRALEDALQIVDGLAFPIDTNDRSQMLKIIASCIGTKFTSRFGSLMPVRLAAALFLLWCCHSHASFRRTEDVLSAMRRQVALLFGHASLRDCGCSGWPSLPTVQEQRLGSPCMTSTLYACL